MPSLAFTLGHYSDIAVSSLITCVSGIDFLVKDKEFREAAGLFVGIPLAVNLAFRVVDLINDFSTYNIVGIVLQTLCFAKLILIAKGQNYNNSVAQG
jgi:hypothetical protein